MLDSGYLRPRYDGFVHVQDTSFLISHDFLNGTRTADETLDALDELYRSGRHPQ